MINAEKFLHPAYHRAHGEKVRLQHVAPSVPVCSYQIKYKRNQRDDFPAVVLHNRFNFSTVVWFKENKQWVCWILKAMRRGDEGREVMGK